MKRIERYSLALMLLMLGAACTDNRVEPSPPPPAPAPPAPPPQSPPPAPVLGQEHEPNNTRAAANTVSLGDSIAGQVSLPGDVDYFAVDLQLGTNVAIVLSDPPSIKDWSWTMSLLDTNGATLSTNDEYSDWLPGTRIWYTVTKTGRYYVRLNNRPLWGGADPNATAGDYPYSLRIVAFRATRESESNDAAEMANTIALGDTISGTIALADDRDYFALDLNAGTNLSLDVSSQEVSCDVVPELRLWTSDKKELSRAGSSPYNGSWNPLLEYPITTTGRYFISLGRHFGGETNPCYFLKVGTFTLPPPGPGDPVRVIANLGYFSAITSDKRGDVFLSTGTCEPIERRPTDKVAHLEKDGSVSVIADHLMLSGEPAIDGFGEILAPGFQTGTGAHLGVVWRISPGGERSIFVQGLDHPCALAVGPDGDVWVIENRSGHTLRLDSRGNIKATVELGSWASGHMAFGPEGVLYYWKSFALYKLQNGDTTRLSYPVSAAWTFDQDGYLYSYQGGYWGYNRTAKIVLLDPSGQFVVDPVAWINSPLGFAFLRDQSGKATKRLLVLRYDSGVSSEIVELNPNGIRAPGP
ncbi:MAG: hypothetical protein AUH96_10200 [Nitrospirae bacterium 13_2_20CM_2_61_4]|nr:MAG: hypothetical protein AUH96_10200 [Nitrospirae bacterium 13_2_20CM_2_61_4]